MKKLKKSLLFLSLFFVVFSSKIHAVEFERDDVKMRIPNMIFGEFYLTLFHSYNGLSFNNNELYKGVIDSKMAANFGGGIGFIVNDILFFELSMFGGKNTISTDTSVGIQNGNINTVFLRMNSGLRVPLMTNEFSLLLSAGGLVYFQSGKYSYTNNVVAAGFSETNIGILPEFGIGLEYRPLERFGLRFQVFYAAPVNTNNTSPLLKSVLTIQTGIFIKL